MTKRTSRQWLTAEQFPTAWVSLDADDNDPIRFWLYLGASLDALEPALGASICELLRSPQPPPMPSVVIMLCNALTTLARKCVLVLDDYHVISAPQIHEGLAFLLRTALLDRLSASLCNALTGRDDGQAMLEHLERANLFLIPLDDEQRWYRYHHLFGEFLRDRLRSASANLLPALYQRASAMCEREGLLDEAVGYALSAAQLDTRLTAHAADLIERVGYTVWMSGATGTISMWLDRL